MRVAEAATELGISERSVYRLIKEGVMPAAVHPRDRPVLGYEVDPALIHEVQKVLASLPEEPTPSRVKEILLEVLI